MFKKTEHTCLSRFIENMVTLGLEVVKDTHWNCLVHTARELPRPFSLLSSTRSLPFKLSGDQGMVGSIRAQHPTPMPPSGCP